MAFPWFSKDIHPSYFTEAATKLALSVPLETLELVSALYTVHILVQYNEFHLLSTAVIDDKEEIDSSCIASFVVAFL